MSKPNKRARCRVEYEKLNFILSFHETMLSSIFSQDFQKFPKVMVPFSKVFHTFSKISQKDPKMFQL